MFKKIEKNGSDSKQQKLVFMNNFEIINGFHRNVNQRMKVEKPHSGFQFRFGFSFVCSFIVAAFKSKTQPRMTK
jgi:hypothetical protein